MDTSDFEFLRILLKDQSGLVMSEDKAYLMESRLIPTAKRWGFAGIPSMVIAMRGLPDPKLIQHVVEAMMTHDTVFFRDYKAFHHLEKNVLPPLLRARSNSRKLRVWSAAASSGQEIYSLAILLKEAGVLGYGWHPTLLATDIDNEILVRARHGEYSQFEVQRGLPIRRLVTNFFQSGEKWRIRDDLRNAVTFQTHNLLDPVAALGTFDIIACRNVLHFFDAPTRTEVLRRLSGQLAPDGVLILGLHDAVPEGFKAAEEAPCILRRGA